MKRIDAYYRAVRRAPSGVARWYNRGTKSAVAESACDLRKRPTKRIEERPWFYPCRCQYSCKSRMCFSPRFSDSGASPKHRAGSESPRSRPLQPKRHQHWKVRLRREFSPPPTTTNTIPSTHTIHLRPAPLQIRRQTPPPNMPTSPPVMIYTSTALPPVPFYHFPPPSQVPSATAMTEPSQKEDEPGPTQEDILAMAVTRQALAVRLAKEKDNNNTEMVYLLASVRLEKAFPNVFHPKALRNYHDIGNLLEHRRKTYVAIMGPRTTTAATKRSTPKKVTTFTPDQIAVYRRATRIIRQVTTYLEKHPEEMEDGEIMD
jgi:hypothetical protein